MKISSELENCLRNKTVENTKENLFDLSIKWIKKNEDLKKLEDSISIFDFVEEANTRNIEMEFRVIF